MKNAGDRVSEIYRILKTQNRLFKMIRIENSDKLPIMYRSYVIILKRWEGYSFEERALEVLELLKNSIRSDEDFTVKEHGIIISGTEYTFTFYIEGYGKNSQWKACFDTTVIKNEEAKHLHERYTFIYAARQTFLHHMSTYHLHRRLKEWEEKSGNSIEATMNNPGLILDYRDASMRYAAVYRLSKCFTETAVRVKRGKYAEFYQERFLEVFDTEEIDELSEEQEVYLTELWKLFFDTLKEAVYYGYCNQDEQIRGICRWGIGGVDLDIKWGRIEPELRWGRIDPELSWNGKSALHRYFGDPAVLSADDLFSVLRYRFLRGDGCKFGARTGRLGRYLRALKNNDEIIEFE